MTAGGYFDAISIYLILSKVEVLLETVEYYEDDICSQYAKPG